MKKKLLLEVNQIECSRNSLKIFKPISFQLFSGDLFIIKGKNGSGKTSLIHCLVGLIPFRGEMFWNIQDSPIASFHYFSYDWHLLCF